MYFSLFTHTCTMAVVAAVLHCVCTFVFFLFIEPFQFNLHFILSVLLLFHIPLQRTRQFVFVTRHSLLIVHSSSLLLLQRLSLHFFRTRLAYTHTPAYTQITSQCWFFFCCCCCSTAILLAIRRYSSRSFTRSRTRSHRNVHFATHSLRLYCAHVSSSPSRSRCGIVTCFGFSFHHFFFFNLLICN